MLFREDSRFVMYKYDYARLFIILPRGQRKAKYLSLYKYKKLNGIVLSHFHTAN